MGRECVRQYPVRSSSRRARFSGRPLVRTPTCKPTQALRGASSSESPALDAAAAVSYEDHANIHPAKPPARPQAHSVRTMTCGSSPDPPERICSSAHKHAPTQLAHIGRSGRAGAAGRALATRSPDSVSCTCRAVIFGSARHLGSCGDFHARLRQGQWFKFSLRSESGCSWPSGPGQGPGKVVHAA